MEFRTVIEPVGSAAKISYQTPVMLTGSCFAGEMGDMLAKGRMNVLVNPFGVLYNPASVARQFELLMSGYTFSGEDLRIHDGKYLSFDHGTAFSGRDASKVADHINFVSEEAGKFLAKAGFLFITFGTARVFRWKETGRIVSNCHKIPQSEFIRELLSIEAVSGIWINLLKKLKDFNPGIEVVFTVSPVRHWKDGAHGNQVSKAVLLLAIEEIVNAIEYASYFPSYEFLLDDLRDYRFYAPDMLHPSGLASDYIGSHFRETYFDSKTRQAYNDISGVILARKHRIEGSDKNDLNRFYRIMLSKIGRLEEKYPFADLSGDRNYFEELAGK